MRAADLMTSEVVSVGPDTSLRAAARLMVRERIGSLCVLGPDDELLGLITEADLVRLVLHQDPTRHLTPVDTAPATTPTTAGEAMTTSVVAVPPDADVADLATLMLEQHLTRVPVVEGRRLVGVVSRSDLLRPLCRPDEEISEELSEAMRDLPGDGSAAVEEGQVTLTDCLDVDLAVRIAWGVPGVTGVTATGAATSGAAASGGRGPSA